jgi:pyruvate formate lyase activating enzyme
MTQPHWTPAEFYHLQDGRLLCTLCPHACRLVDGETGRCHVRRCRDGRLETATRAATVRHFTPVERKPFYHYHPGRLCLTLAAPGCSFTCLYCQNYRLSQFGRNPEAPWRGEPVTPADVVAEARSRQAAIALSYTEPGLAAELTLELATAAGLQGVDILWKSNGFLTPEAVARLAPYLAAVNVDLKTVNDRRHRAFTGAPVAPVLETIAALRAAGVWVELSTPLIPKFNTDPRALCDLIAAVRELGTDIPWHLLRFTPDYRLRRRPPGSPRLLAETRHLALTQGLHYVYIERAAGPEARNTHCPGCGCEVVCRDIQTTRTVALRDGACPHCGQPIPGRW